MKRAGTSRPYVMGRRADQTAKTADRILDATVDLFVERPYDQLTLAAVAQRADVTRQTVNRRFGDKEGLVSAAVVRTAAQVGEQRDEAPVGDLRGAVDNLVEHYERLGTLSLRLLPEEQGSPALADVTVLARSMHRSWCLRVFAPWLSGGASPPGTDHDRLVAQLVAVCDVYTWKMLRHDAHLSRRQTTLALCELLEGLLADRPVT